MKTSELPPQKDIVRIILIFLSFSQTSLSFSHPQVSSHIPFSIKKERIWPGFFSLLPHLLLAFLERMENSKFQTLTRFFSLYPILIFSFIEYNHKPN